MARTTIRALPSVSSLAMLDSTIGELSSQTLHHSRANSAVPVHFLSRVGQSGLVPASSWHSLRDLSADLRSLVQSDTR